MRLIDADALKETELDFDTDDDCTLFCVAIDNAPTIEAEPVRHGRWIEKASTYYKAWKEAFGSDRFLEECEYFADHIACSNCLKKYNYIDNSSTDEWNYCPNCGAKIDGGQNK